MKKIICKNLHGCIIRNFFQWDANQRMIIEGLCITDNLTVHFSNKMSYESLVVNTTVDERGVIVDIPNILLQHAEQITAYICTQSEEHGFQTMHAISIPVIARPKPADYIFEENIEYITLSSLEAELSNARIGWNGIVYNTAGDAIRALHDDLIEEFNKIILQISHDALLGRDEPNQHSIDAITGLSEVVEGLTKAINETKGLFEDFPIMVVDEMPESSEETTNKIYVSRNNMYLGIKEVQY